MEKQKAERKPAIKFSVQKTDDGGTTVGPDHPDLETGTALLKDALGTTDGHLLDAFMNHLANLTQNSGEVNEPRLNQTLALIRGIDPQDPVEAMLAVQMSAVHINTLNYARLA